VQTISGGSWFTIGDECRFRAEATSSDEAYLIFGEPPHQHELSLSREALRELVAKGTTVLAEIDRLAAQEA
jgi:hypothetical protein